MRHSDNDWILKFSLNFPSDAVLIDLPVRRPETYAFSVPFTSIYSLIVHPPTISSWRMCTLWQSWKTCPDFYFDLKTAP